MTTRDTSVPAVAGLVGRGGSGVVARSASRSPCCCSPCSPSPGSPSTAPARPSRSPPPTRSPRKPPAPAPRPSTSPPPQHGHARLDPAAARDRRPALPRRRRTPTAPLAGTVTVAGDRIHVEVTLTAPTLLLGLVGVDTVTTTGAAQPPSSPPTPAIPLPVAASGMHRVATDETAAAAARPGRARRPGRAARRGPRGAVGARPRVPAHPHTDPRRRHRGAGPPRRRHPADRPARRSPAGASGPPWPARSSPRSSTGPARCAPSRRPRTPPAPDPGGRGAADRLDRHRVRQLPRRSRRPATPRWRSDSSRRAAGPRPGHRATPPGTAACTSSPPGTRCGTSPPTELGDPLRWREILDLNRGRPQPDGGRLTRRHRPARRLDPHPPRQPRTEGRTGSRCIPATP